MTSQNESEEITPLKVSPTTVWHDNQNANRVSENDEAPLGAFTDEQAEDLGFKHPSKLGDSALNVVSMEEYPDDIEVHDPSDATIKLWPEEFRYQYTSDGTRWLCAIDSNNKVFAKVEATSDIDSKNTDMLLKETQQILSDFRSIRGQQSLGLEEPKDIAA